MKSILITLLCISLASYADQGVNSYQLEQVRIEMSYQADFGGDGLPWTCNVNIEGDSIGDPNTLISLEILDGSSPIGWWNGWLSSSILDLTADEIELILSEPIYIVAVSEELVSLYLQKENFVDFTGYAIGIRPASTVIAFDPVMYGVVKLITPEIIQEAEWEEDFEFSPDLVSGAADIIMSSDPELGVLLMELACSCN